MWRGDSRKPFMKFSIFTTVLEADEKLARSIRSIRSKHPYDHVVTVARNFEKAQAMARELKWTCSLVSTPGARISAGFNEAVKRTTSDLLWPLNAGDECVDVDPLVETLIERPEFDIAYGDTLEDGMARKWKRPPITTGTIRLHGMPYCHGGIVYRRRLHDLHGYYPEDYPISMDFAFLAKAIASGSRSAYVPKVVAEIEAAGNSGRAWARSVDSGRAIRPFTPAPVAWLMVLKWTCFSHIRDALRSLEVGRARATARAGVGPRSQG
jgi:hypothetical protein